MGVSRENSSGSGNSGTIKSVFQKGAEHWSKEHWRIGTFVESNLDRKEHRSKEIGTSWNYRRTFVERNIRPKEYVRSKEIGTLVEGTF